MGDIFDNGSKPFVELPSVRIICCYQCGFIEFPEPDSIGTRAEVHKDMEWCECGALRLVIKLYNRG
jgi:hypothetical protein